MTDEPRRLVVVGAGGVGTWLAQALVRMLEYKLPGSMLVIVDGDNFEQKNKERQSFKGAGNKADVLAHELQGDFPNTMIVPLAKWVVADEPESDEEEVDEDGVRSAGVVTASKLLQEDDVIYAVVDNFKARKDICDAARSYDNIDIFLGGNDEELYGSVYQYRRRDGVDITEHPSVRSEEYVNPPDRNPGELSCAERAEIDGGTQLIAANFGVVAFLLGRTQATILTDGNFLANDVKFDLGHGLAQAYDRTVEEAEVLATSSV